MSLTISSASFPSGGEIPRKFTCEGEDASPQLSWNGAPSTTQAFALIADDPDAPAGTWTHWILYDVPGSATSLGEGLSKAEQLPDGSRQGRNDFRRIGYNGPCPPAGKPHRYFFKLYALDRKLNLKPTASRSEVEKAMQGHVQAQGEYMGTYRRSGS
ncbi:MAG TPA: YbhB/YbcL family Raf kinase inhibitor-like protein [Terriglobales bacterium]|nr:YbhB/YbcL family Raf kinase inhibitor-like protein [Terriglobales bacterium]